MTGKRVQEARRWFQQAFYDLEAARWNLKGGFNNTVCFLAQQSGEKALKSLLYYIGSRRHALLTHSLVDMIQEAERKAPGFKDLMDKGRELDLHYIPSRYPNGLPGGYPHQFYGKRVAEQALKAAEKIFDMVQGYYENQKEEGILKPD
jgi:HEPN domain-containing protein